MKTSKKTSVALTAAVLLLGASVAHAANITISDNNTGSNGSAEDNGSGNSGWYKGGAAYLATSGATQAKSEYQEVEPGMQIGAAWDLAAFVTPGSGRLGVVSAYNLGAGYGNTTIGDIMVSLNPSSLGGYADPGTPYPHYVANSAYGYNFAVKFNFTNSTYTVLQINANTLMENGEYNTNQYGGYNYNAASQPWRVANAYSGNYDAAHGYNLGTAIYTGSLYYSNTASVAAMSALTGYTVTNEYKYYAEIGTSWLNSFLPPTNPSVLYKLTMECGNDNMLGTQTSGFNQVPDASATAALLGLGFLGLAGFAKFKGRKIG
ncbi:MAG: VPDSG-CTERM sorting domain-containing protein [Verrucomicrobia bacterium]|nr:VPDSG-CTERM sorting domain-containing protein [Verrucomicrobiota bacterium]